MIDILVAAIPAYIALMFIEMALFKHAHDDQPEGHAGYEKRDTNTSLTMGVGSVLINAVWKLPFIAVLAALYELTPIRPDLPAWAYWTALILLVDFLYYLDHRFHHRVRFGWASHVVHHSSEHYNLSTALRQSWTMMVTSSLFFFPVALLGFTPATFLVAYGVNLLYQFWIHTERIGRLPTPVEFVFNTPSHHRVHHGADADYLDKNYAGILIIWDRMFGTFAQETKRPTYGLTTNIHTYKPVRVAFHEWQAMFRDARQADNWRDKLGYIVGPPGWRPKTEAAEPAASGLTTQATAARR